MSYLVANHEDRFSGDKAHLKLKLRDDVYDVEYLTT